MRRYKTITLWISKDGGCRKRAIIWNKPKQINIVEEVKTDKKWVDISSFFIEPQDILMIAKTLGYIDKK